MDDRPKGGVMSHNIISIDGTDPNAQGEITLGAGAGIYMFRVNSNYLSGSFSYAGPLNVPFYNGLTGRNTVVETSGFTDKQDSSELVILQSGTNPAYWWDLLTIPAGRWIVRAMYADHQSNNVNGYLQIQDSSGNALGPRCHYSALSAGCGMAVGFIDSATSTTIRVRFVGSGAFYRTYFTSHFFSSLQVSRV
jgi:hypothetical protein